MAYYRTLESQAFTEWVRVLTARVTGHLDEEQHLYAAARALLSHEQLEAVGQAMDVQKRGLIHSD